MVDVVSKKGVVAAIATDLHTEVARHAEECIMPLAASLDQSSGGKKGSGGGGGAGGSRSSADGVGRRAGQREANKPRFLPLTWHGYPRARARKQTRGAAELKLVNTFAPLR